MRMGGVWLVALAAVFAASMWTGARADPVTKLRLDYASYNPVSLVLKDKGLLEAEFAKDNITIEWVQSAGSNKALEYLANNTVDFGSAAGAAALLARIGGAPVKAVYVFSRPEWTALVVPANSPLQSVADLKGKKVAVTKGTDPHVFLLRALSDAGLGEKDITLVALQHADGRAAMEKGDVDAWAGLDPLMAQSELIAHSRLLFRDPYLNTYGTLNVREDFLAAHADLIQRVLKVYDQARMWAVQNPAALRTALMQAAKIDEAVAARQLERTDLRNSSIGQAQQRTIQAAGEALQASGVINASVDVAKTVSELIDRRFAVKKTAQQ
jgi:sulfonate transport system substrate-binding protein